MAPPTAVHALELLRSQHTQLDQLIEAIEHCAGGSNRKPELFQQLADRLAAHASIEEKIFYPAVMTGHTRGQLIEATEEHLAVKRLLVDMMELACNDEHFDAKLTVLKESLRHHAHDEEETALFPQILDAMDDVELVALGSEMLAMFESLIGLAPRKNVPAETKRAAQLHA